MLSNDDAENGVPWPTIPFNFCRVRQKLPQQKSNLQMKSIISVFYRRSKLSQPRYKETNIDSNVSFCTPVFVCNYMEEFLIHTRVLKTLIELRNFITGADILYF